MTLAAGLLGAIFAVGVVTFAVALRPVDPRQIPPTRRASLPTSSLKLDQLTVRFVAAGVLGILTGALTRWPMAAAMLAAAGFMAPSVMGGGAERKARLALIEAVASWAEMLRDTMAAAGGLEQSIVASAPIAPPPIRPHVVRLAAALERQQLSMALRMFADDVDNPAGDLVVAALLLAADKSPKQLGELLGRLAQAARADVNMRLRVEASRARTRTAVRVVILFTIGFSSLLILFNRQYLDPYDSLVGQGVLGAVGACFGGAFIWLAKSFRFDDDPRFLRTDVYEVVR